MLKLPVNELVVCINKYTFKCVACGYEFNIEESESTKCTNCDKILFINKNEPYFKIKFKHALLKTGVDIVDINRFFNSDNVKISDLKICTELSIIIDLEMQIIFGSDYKGFTINETFNEILDYNFKKLKETTYNPYNKW